MDLTGFPAIGAVVEAVFAEPNGVGSLTDAAIALAIATRLRLITLHADRRLAHTPL
jgi:hypothetical protein